MAGNRRRHRQQSRRRRPGSCIAYKHARGLPYLITHRRRRFALTPCKSAIRATDYPRLGAPPRQCALTRLAERTPAVRTGLGDKTLYKLSGPLTSCPPSQQWTPSLIALVRQTRRLGMTLTSDPPCPKCPVGRVPGSPVPRHAWVSFEASLALEVSARSSIFDLGEFERLRSSA